MPAKDIGRRQITQDRHTCFGVIFFGNKSDLVNPFFRKLVFNIKRSNAFDFIAEEINSIRQFVTPRLDIDRLPLTLY